jgi:hypothetical protein
MNTEICTTQYTYSGGGGNSMLTSTAETCVLQPYAQQYLDLFSFLAMFIIFVVTYKLIKNIVFSLLK